jgi:hypothetical protein
MIFPGKNDLSNATVHVIVSSKSHSELQDRKKVWKSGGGASSTVVGIIYLPWLEWGLVTYLPKYGGGDCPPAPTVLTAYYFLF